VVRNDPAVVVVFAGTNDLSGKTPRSAAWLEERFVELVARLRALGCRAPLVYVSITKAPSRAEHRALVDDANARIAARCAADPSLVFVDTASGMLGSDGVPDPKWFQKDLLHLNADGYRHWTATIRPVVEKLLAAGPNQR
jgi:lysophospholipase L1-like esterase